MNKGKMIVRSAALICFVFGITCTPLSRAAEGASGKMFQLVTKQGKKVVAEFSLSENDSVMIVMENGVPQVRDINADAGMAGRTEAPASGQQASNIEKAKVLLQKNDYDAVISLLADDAYRHPDDFEMNLLLTRAEVEKCDRQKEKGDSSYKAPLRSIYQRAQRLYTMNRNHPEPYYIVAKSLYLNDRAPKAYDTIRKAVYYEPLNPYYQLLYGDLSMEQAATWQGDKDSAGYMGKMHKQALAAYESALANTKDEELANKIRARIERIRKIAGANI